MIQNGRANTIKPAVQVQVRKEGKRRRLSPSRLTWIGAEELRSGLATGTLPEMQ